MTINSNLNIFCGKVVEDYTPEEGIINPEKIVYRIKLTYDDYSEEKRIESFIEAFVSDPKAKEVSELIIGAYDFESSVNSSDLVKCLSENNYKLPNLKYLFIGDITYEEFEISWIIQSDMSPVLNAYPNLVHFQVRGGSELSLGKLSHPNLETLIVESGGLPPNVISEVCSANLPKLKHLELWLGSDDYGYASEMKDFEPLLSGGLFPELKFLGLKDSVVADEIAKALKGAKVLDLIEDLDLSMGTLSDEGGQELLNNPAILKLKFLNLRHHYLSNEMMEKFEALPIEVELDDQQADDEGYRYVEVAE